MTRWYAAADMTGELTDDDIMDIADDKATSIDCNGNTQAAKIRIVVDADTYDQAAHDALTAFAKLANVQRLIAAGTLSQPHRFTLQTEQAEEQSLSILSTAGVAERLGVSAARVRQIKEIDLDFPRPFTIPGAAGDFYRTVDVDQYASSRKPGTSAQGKPRAGDEQLLNDGLRGLLDAPLTLDLTETSIIERALNSEGGRFIRGKAKVLVETAERYHDKLGPGGSSDHSLEALKRAREIWRP